MKKWICKVCGYTHEGEEAPMICPQCGATRVRFYRKVDSSTRGCAMSIIAILILLAILCLIFYTCS